MGDSSSFAAHCYPRAAPVVIQSSSGGAAMFCCLFVCCDEQRQVGRRRINGMCSTCAGAVRNVRVQNVFRCCFVPVCLMQRSRIVCSRCGHHYKTRCSSKL